MYRLLVSIVSALNKNYILTIYHKNYTTHACTETTVIVFFLIEITVSHVKPYTLLFTRDPFSFPIVDIFFFYWDVPFEPSYSVYFFSVDTFAKYVFFNDKHIF